MTQAFDLLGIRTKLHDATGRYTSTFDAVNRERTVTTQANKTISYLFDAASQRQAMVAPEGGRFSYGFDDAGRWRYVANAQHEQTSSNHIRHL